MTAATTDRVAARPPLGLAVGDLTVIFEWDGDRWRHRVMHRDRLVAESVEGPGPAGDASWPASPPCQEVADAAPGRAALLAVGAAGRSHFAASVAADPARSDTVIIEVACRIREPAGWLGSTYRVAGGGTVRVAAAAAGTPPRTVCWTYRIGPAGVEPADVAEPRAGQP